MRWTSRVRVLSRPGSSVVLVFIVLGLFYPAFANVTKRPVNRLEVPRLDNAGKPVLKPDGTPRTRTEVKRETVTKWEWVGLTNFSRVFRDPQVLEAVRFTAIFVASACRSRCCSACAGVSVQSGDAGPVAVAHDDDPADLRDAGGGGISVLHHLLRGRRPAGLDRYPVALRPGLGALVSVIIVDVWQWTPFCFLVFLAALQGIPDERSRPRAWMRFPVARRSRR